MRLISANDLLALVKKNAPFIHSIVAPITLLCPTIEAEPVRHGKWIDKGLEGDFSWKLDGRGSCWRVLACSVCGNNLCGRPGSDFCPHCGAKMDLK